MRDAALLNKNPSKSSIQSRQSMFADILEQRKNG